MQLPVSAPVRVLLADDHREFAEALGAQLDADERIAIVGQARSGDEAVELVESLQPHVVLMDLAMPGMTGLEATRRIHEAHPETLVLILTGSDSVTVGAACEAGASGFLTKDALSTEIASTILELAAFAAISARAN